MCLVALTMVSGTGEMAAGKPISDNSPVLFQAASTDLAGPAVRLTLAGLSADFLRGDVRVGAELTTSLKARMFIIADNLHVLFEAGVVRWRASIALGGWRPMTNLVRLAERMMGGMEAVHHAVESLPSVVEGQLEEVSARMRPWGRSLRMAGEALDSLWNAQPGWIVVLDAMGRTQDPLGLRLDPLYELSVTATLVF